MMKQNKHQWTFVIESIDQLKHLGMHQNSSFLLGHQDFSRVGGLDQESFIKLSQLVKDQGRQVIFEWDILSTENEIHSRIELFNKLDLSHVDRIRVQDFGIFLYLLNSTNFDLELICENGVKNLKALVRLEMLGGERLKKLVLSSELDKGTLHNLSKNLKTPIEILGLGRIPLFYTPRGLLSHHLDSNKQEERIEMLGSSEESPHKGFPLVENQHGTFMFYTKYFCLLDRLKEIELIDRLSLKVDLRFDQDWTEQVSDLLLNPIDKSFKSFKNSFHSTLIRGFFEKNRSNILFPKLKNHRIQRKDNHYVGIVTAVEKGECVVIQVQGNSQIEKEQFFYGLGPEGKKIQFPVKQLHRLSMEPIEKADNGHVRCQFVKGIIPKTLIYRL